MTITKAKAIEDLKEIISEKGEDFVYRTRPDQNCVYVRNGEPSCLIGRLFHKWGVPLENLASYDNIYSNDAGSVGEYFEDNGFFTLEYGVMGFLVTVQGNQDTAYVTWGEALNAALENRFPEA